MDDALDLGPGLGLDRDDVAAVAEGDDRILEGAAELRSDEGVEPAPEPVVRDADRCPQPAEPRRGKMRRGVAGSASAKRPFEQVNLVLGVDGLRRTDERRYALSIGSNV